MRRRTSLTTSARSSTLHVPAAAAWRGVASGEHTVTPDRERCTLAQTVACEPREVAHRYAVAAASAA
jgi:hypothetical protein